MLCRAWLYRWIFLFLVQLLVPFMLLRGLEAARIPVGWGGDDDID